MTEVWKPIPGYEGYEVSNHGRVRSYKARLGNGNGWETVDTPQRILKQQQNPRGYCFVNLAGRINYIYHLVMLAFVGPRPEGMVVCHNDDNPANNHLDNLRYDTQAGNIADCVVRRDNWKAKQMPEDATDMQRLMFEIRKSKMMNQAEFAELLGVSQGMLSMLESGERLPGRKTIKGLITVASTEQAQAILNALKDDRQGHGDNGAHPQQDTTE